MDWIQQILLIGAAVGMIVPRFPLSVPLEYGDKPDNSQIVDLVREHCDAYFEREVRPHVPDAWIDHDKTKVGYEIPFNRHFYVFKPPRPLSEIDAELKVVTDRILAMIGGLTK